MNKDTHSLLNRVKVKDKVKAQHMKVGCPSITSKSTCALNWGWRWGFSRIQNQPLILSRTPHSHSSAARTSLLSCYVFVQWKRWKEPASNIWRALCSHFEFNHCLKKEYLFWMKNILIFSPSKGAEFGWSDGDTWQRRGLAVCQITSNENEN